MPRREFSARTKDQAWRRSGGHCETGRVAHMPEVGCGRKLAPGDIFYEHVDPDGLTGEPTLENAAVLCGTCWRIKSSKYDIPAVAKAKRRERAHHGIKRSSRRLPGGRDSNVKIKIGIGPVDRKTGVPLRRRL